MNYAVRLFHLRRRIIDCIRSGWPDVLYYRKGLIDLGFFYAALRWAGPLYMEINGNHAADFHDLGRHMLSRLLNLSYSHKLSRADLIVSVSPGLREHLLRQYPRIEPQRVIVVQNGVDTETFHPMERACCRRELNIDPGLFILVFSGRIAKWHGLGTALDAMEALSESWTGRIRLYVVGDGPFAAEVKEDVKARGLEQQVFFTGLMPASRVATYIGAADVCVAPFTAQRNDTIGISPLKIFEYVACGRPVITSRVKGLAEIVEEVGDGGQITLVDPDNGSALAAAIEQTLQQPSAQTAVIDPVRLRGKISWSARAKVVYDHLVRDVALYR